MAALWSVWDISLISHPYFAVEDEREREREKMQHHCKLICFGMFLLFCCAVLFLVNFIKCAY